MSDKATIDDAPFALGDLLQGSTEPEKQKKQKSALAREAKSAAKVADHSVAESVVDRAFGLRKGVLDGGKMYWVDVNLIDDNPFQPRSAMDEFALDEFYDDIDTNGQSTPGLARRYSKEEIKKNPALAERVQLAYAHRRKECVKRGANPGPPDAPDREKYAGKLLIQIRDLSNEQMLSEAIRENEQRDDVSTIDSARSYVKLRELTTHALVAAGEIEPYAGKVKAGDEQEYLTVDGQCYKQASWRVVSERHGSKHGSKTNMHRTAQILKLPADMQKSFAPDPKNPLAFILNTRHGRVLCELQKYPDLQRTVYRDILREKLSGNEAERRASEVRKARPTPLDLELQEAAKQQIKAQGEQSRAQAAEKNRQALAQGKSHLSVVGGSTVGGDASTQDEAKSVDIVGGAWYRAEDVFDELNDVLRHIKVKGTEEIAEEYFQILSQQKATMETLWRALEFEVKKLRPNRE